MSGEDLLSVCAILKFPAAMRGEVPYICPLSLLVSYYLSFLFFLLMKEMLKWLRHSNATCLENNINNA